MCLQNKSFENSTGKGAIALYEQFVFFPQRFYPFRELSTIFIKFQIVICIKLYLLVQTCLPPTTAFRNIGHENQEHQKIFR